MSHRKHRVGVSKNNLVSRHLKLEPASAESIQAAILDIEQLLGLDDVSVDERRRMLHLSYDASRLCLDCVEEVLATHAIEVSHGWWNRFKEEHYRFVDQNVKDNARQDHWSCHQSPPRRRLNN